ncbi:MAG: hydantoinase/oxoprolinase family protein, partial [Geminicoccaceae bacterium]
MGGTTAKVCLIAGGAPDRSRRFEVARIYRDLKGSGLPLRIPVIDMVEIGAGGGSIGRVDRLGRITVGPDSAGADPGPASYRRGGAFAAVTDANLLLGRIDPDGFAGGEIALDPSLAEAAVKRDLCDPLDMECPWAAAGMIEIVDENMANAARVHAIERGRVIGRHSMIAFGGSAPLHAARLAEKLGIERVIVPVGAGVGSAIGFLRAPLAYEVVRSRRMALDVFDASAANGLIAAMAEAALDVLTPALGERLTKTEPERSLAVDMRYIGQGHELSISLPTRDLEPVDSEAIAAIFEETYQAIYGVRLDHVGIEITAWSLTLSVPVSKTPTAVTPATVRYSAKPIGNRNVYDPGEGAFQPCAIYRRADLLPGMSCEGPAVVVEDQTSTVVPTGWQASVTGDLGIVLERAGEGAS